MKVSVVVPVYNPGEHIEPCIESLLSQTLPNDEYEAIFVDDGSTDATPARLDRLAAEHENVRVEHIPNSGWPGKPRNVGTDMAKGEFVLYVDNDDWIEPDALERLYDTAIRDEADIVVGKVVGHGKFVARDLFKKNRSGETLESYHALLTMLTPHKLFRRSMLADNGIRFPEGRRRLEDHVFTVHAYFHAKRISVIADHPIYHWVRYEDGNVSYEAFDPVGYYANVREVLDLVVEHTEPGPFRERLLSHWYRGKMLNRVGGPSFMKREPQYRRELHAEIQKLAHERFDDGVHAWLAPSRRVRSHLLREGSLESLEKLSELEADLRADVTVTYGRWKDDGTFIIPFEARLVERNDRPLRFERRGDDRVFWVPPDLPDELPDRVLEVTDDVFGSRARLIVRSRKDKREYIIPSRNKVKLEPTGDGYLTPVMRGTSKIEPDSGGGGSPLPPGRWFVLAGVNVTGFHAVGRVRKKKTDAEYKIRVSEDGLVRRKRGPQGMEAPSLKGRLARRMPGLARALRKARGARREAASG